MRYKVVYMPSPSYPLDEWFDTDVEAWNYIANIKCGFGTGDLCEMCQAEYDVFSEQELQEIESGQVHD